MSEPLLKVLVRRGFRWVLKRSLTQLGEEAMHRSALIFAPHPDDETLGCGGTIIKRRKMGATVGIVFMTDGRRSHRHLMSEEELRIIRAREARSASRMLGVKDEDVFLLDLEDGKLKHYQEEVVQRVADILSTRQPDDVFIPYRKEPEPDHWATNKIVTQALRQVERDFVVYEFPVWLWHNWPWTTVRIGSRRSILRLIKNSILAGWRLWGELRTSVYVGDVLLEKRAALDQHQSQMKRLIPDPAWHVLSDLSNGEFLDCFLQEYEIFHRYEHSG